MLQILKDQKIDHRRGQADAGRPRRSRPRAVVRQSLAGGTVRVSRFTSIVPDTFRLLFGRNRYFFIVAVSLLCLFFTGFVFSWALQGTLTPPPSAAAAAAAGEDTAAQALAAAYDELGSGTFAPGRDRDVGYGLQGGDSLY